MSYMYAYKTCSLTSLAPIIVHSLSRSLLLHARRNKLREFARNSERQSSRKLKNCKIYDRADDERMNERTNKQANKNTRPDFDRSRRGSAKCQNSFDLYISFSSAEPRHFAALCIIYIYIYFVCTMVYIYV